jgi:hypothetical protein
MKDTEYGNEWNCYSSFAVMPTCVTSFPPIPLEYLLTGPTNGQEELYD